MTSKSRTIDHLGAEASIRYATDQARFDPRYIEESRLIPRSAEISVATPFLLSEFDQLFQVDKTLLWALFTPPSNYFSSVNAIFSYQLIPSLGDEEKREADLAKLESLEDASNKPHKKVRRKGASKDNSDAGDEGEEQERLKLIAMIQSIDRLDKILTAVNSRRNQYQRG